jgi:hypothetical protein
MKSTQHSSQYKSSNNNNKTNYYRQAGIFTERLKNEVKKTKKRTNILDIREIKKVMEHTKHKKS